MLKKIVALFLLLSFNKLVYSNSSLENKIVFFSAKFLNKPYILHPLGEGKNGIYDQKPLFRTDGFDCLTYVETVIALATNDSSVIKKLSAIRYYKGKVNFLTRNHFTSVDWNYNNQKSGLLKDITKSIRLNNKPVYKYSITTIDKPGWYQKLPESIIYLRKPNKKLALKKWQQLKAAGKNLPVKIAKVPYIPLTKIFMNNKATIEILKQIPNASIIEIVRPNWQTKDLVGTNLDISHLGFAIWSNGILMFREASSEKHAVVDIPMIEYLTNAEKSPTIKGINIQILE